MGKELMQEGYAYDEVLSGMGKYVLQVEAPQKKKAVILEILSKCEENLILGAEEMPMLDALSSLFYISRLQF